MMDRRSVAFLVLNCVMAMGQANGQPAQNLDVEVTGLQDAYPAGASVPIGLIVANKSQRAWPLLMSLLGTPSDIFLKVYRTDGPPVGPGPAQRHIKPGPPGPVDAQQLYNVAPGETILLGYDLAALFALDQPGDYVLELMPTPRSAARYKFTLVEPRVISSRQAKGARPRLDELGPFPAGYVGCRICIVEASNGGHVRRYLRVDDCKRWELRGYDNVPVDVEAPASTLPIGLDGELLEAQMDCLGQLWMVLREQSKFRLVLWKMGDRTFDTLISPTEQKIEVGTTRANRMDQHVVIAGVAGKPKLTTMMPRPPAANEQR